MKVLITGASGFVGKWLTQELLAAKHKVSLTSMVPYSFKSDAGDISSSVCDLSDSQATMQLMLQEKPDAVVHLAAYSHPASAAFHVSSTIRSNIIATVNVCEAMSKLSHPVTIVFPSSSYVYGPKQVGETCNEGTPTAPNTVYGRSKLSGELVVQSYESKQFRSYIIRPFNHIGPGQSLDFVCAAFAHKIFHAPNNSVIPVANLSSIRDFCDVRDVAKAYRLVLEHAPAKNVFVIGSGIGISIRTIFDTLVKVSNKQLDPHETPAVPDQYRWFVADANLIKKELGWQPSITLSQSLRDIYFSVSRLSA